MSRTRSIRCFFIFLLCLQGIQCAIAQPARINFTSLGTRDGLISNSITAILKDRYGLMWFATNDGLNKFDGTNFTGYRHLPGDSTSLRSNEILALHEDRAGNLWIGTSGGALSRYDRKSDCFINYPDGSGPGQTRGEGIVSPDHLAPSALVSSICSDDKGRIWIAQYEAPYVLDPATGLMTRMDLHRYIADPSRKLSLSCVYADSHHRVWVGTDRGLFLYLPVTGSFRQYLHRDGDSGSIADNNVRAMAEDRQGDLWVGTGRGLCRWIARTDKFVPFHEHPLSGPPVTGGQINAIAVDKAGIVWVGTGEGLVVIEPKGGRSVTYRPDAANLHSLSSPAITSIYIDANGIYWFGTFRGGIDKYDQNLNLFDLKMSDAFRNGGLQSTIVTSFAEQPDGSIWFGTDGGGLYTLDRRTDEVKRLPIFLDGRPELPLSVLAMKWTRNRQLYIGTYGKGLIAFDPATDRAVRLQTSVRTDDTGANCIFCIWEDRQGQVWTGTNGGGISVLKNGRLVCRLLPNPTTPGDIRMPVNGFIRAIAEDADGRIWIGSHGDGITVYDPHSGRFRVYNQDNGALPSNKVQAILRDSRNRMWLATYGGGLCVYDSVHDKFSTYSEKDGLQNTNVYSVVEDGEGRIWVGTNTGISSLDVKTNVFRNFTPYNGLQNNNFEHTSALHTSDGELFFGGDQGFNYFYPRDLTTNRNVPVVMLTDLKVSNRSVAPGKGSPIQEQIAVASEIRLDYKQNFALSFVALNYTLPHQNRYAYKLDGFDKEWTYAGGLNTAYYTNLDPGEYVFRVKASNNDGVWSKGDTIIHIYVRPPIWRTTFAYILYVLLAGGLLFYSRHRGLARQRRKFAQEQERREARQAQEQERQEVRRAQELDRLKLKFLTNLSHEFRTPISLIMGPVDQLMSEQRHTPSKDKLEMIKRNGRRLLNLVNQLLDFRKMEEQELKLQVSPGELVSFVREIGQSFADLGERKQIRFSFETKMERLYVLFDRDKIERILFNLLSNAFKFTPESGNIMLMLEAGPGEPIDGRCPVTIRVSDTGIGIPADKQVKIFERFFQHASGGAILNQGTGIGLSITREFVLMQGGTITVESEPGQGSVFTVSLQLALVDAVQEGNDGVVAVLGDDRGEEQSEGLAKVGHVEADKNSGTYNRGDLSGEMGNLSGGISDWSGDVGDPPGDVGGPSDDRGGPSGGIGIGDLSNEPAARLTDVPAAVEGSNGKDAEVSNRRATGAAKETERPLILLVEDNEDFRFYLKDNLRNEYEVLEAANGKEGWQQALAAHPRLIVSDINMPYMDGIELTRKLKADKRTSHIPVILLTALTEEAKQLDGLGTGANDYITKPFNFELLNARIKGLLEWNSKMRTTYTKQVKVVGAEPEGQSGNEKLMKRIVSCLEEHLQNPQLSVKFLGKMVGMSRGSLYSKLLEITGETPVEYIRSFRLEKAKALLEKNDLSITEIAYEVGFSTSNYFTRAFKIKYKLSPSDYMNRIRDEKKKNNS